MFVRFYASTNTSISPSLFALILSGALAIADIALIYVIRATSQREEVFTKWIKPQHNLFGQRLGKIPNLITNIMQVLDHNTLLDYLHFY